MTKSHRGAVRKDRPGQKRGITLPMLLIAAGLVAFLSFAGSLHNGFAYDDHVLIEHNRVVTDASESPKVWTEPYWGNRAAGGLFRPLTSWTYVLNHRIGGLSPSGFHLVNVVLHVGVSLLVALLAIEFVGVTGALLVSGLFAAHPIHSEAVANVVGRAELLATLLFLAAWLIHAPPAVGTPRGVFGGDRQAPTWWRRAGVLGFYFLALMAKENAVAFPVALLFRDAVKRRPLDRWTYVLLICGTAVYLAWRYVVLGGITNAPGIHVPRIDNVIASLPFLPGLWTAFSVVGRYVLLLVFPWRLSADYSYPEITAAGPGSVRAWLGLAATVAALVVIVRELVQAARKLPAGSLLYQSGSLGLALAGLTLLPVSNLLYPIGTVMAERLLYLPSVGFLLAAGACVMGLLANRPAWRPAAAGLLSLLILVGAFRSSARAREWKDDATIHAVTVRTSPGSARAHYNYGVGLYNTGQPDAGLKHLDQAIQLDPQYTDVWIQLGGFKMSQGRFNEARADFEKALKIDSTSAAARVNLAALEYVDGHPDASERYCLEVLSRAPDNLDAWFNLALARSALGDTAGTIAAYRKAVELGTRDPQAYDNLAWYLAVSNGPLDEARLAAEKAVALRPDGRSYDTLGEVHFRSRNWPGARAAWNEALRRGVENPDEIRRRLAVIGGD